MKTRTKMMLLKGGRSSDRDYDRPRSERSGSRGWSPETGESYPIYPSGAYRMNYGMEDSMPWYLSPEGRFRDRSGREHYDDGRFAPVRSYYTDYPAVPPIYERASEDSGRRMIGFAVPDEMDTHYRSTVTMPHRNEMERGSSARMGGYAMGAEPMSRAMAMEWVDKMKNSDGTTGPHYTMEQARQVMEQQKIQCDEIEFYVALNMMYSDYCKVAKKFNCNTMEFYACMAKAFLDDKDANPDKLTIYYETIVKH